jgi:small-conductance mechanosensitive channel
VLPPPPSAESLNIQTVPIPPPPTAGQEQQQDRFERDLTRQQDLVSSLQEELRAQKNLSDDLKAQLERQQSETDAVLEQLDTYQEAVESMTSQQVRLIESIPRNNETQTMLLWGILGLFMLLLLAGGTAFTVIALWLIYIQRRTYQPPQQLMYPVRMAQNPYFYYEKQPLPPPAQQPYVQYDVSPYED